MKTLQYWGTGNFQEHPYTGRIVTWTEKEKQTVDDAIATKLLAANAGFVLDNDESGEVVTSQVNSVTGGIEGLTAPDGSVMVINQANSAVLLGDSITGYYNYPLTISSLTRSANVCTATITGHGLVDGQQARVYGVENDDTFNGVYAITRVDANTVTYASTGSDGAASGSSMRMYNRQQTSDQSWASWSNMLLGQRFNILNNGAIGGATIDYLQSRLKSLVYDYAPAYVFVMAGINNVVSSDTAAQIITKLKTLYTSLLTHNYKVVALTILPLGSGYGGYATYAPKIQIINDWIRRYAQTTKGMILVDAYAAIVDPLAATKGSAATGMLSDNLHPSAKGAYTIAKAVKSALQNIVPAVSTLVCNNADNYGNDASNLNMIDNGFWTATGGTLGSNTSGTVASGWVCETTNAATTAVASVPARADGFGYDQQMVVTPGGAHSATARVNIASRLTAGASYQIECEVSMSGVSGSNLAAIQAYINGTAYSATLNLGISNALSLTTFPTEDFTATFKSEVFTVPAAGYTVGTLYVSARFGAAGTALTMKVGRVSVRKVS